MTAFHSLPAVSLLLLACGNSPDSPAGQAGQAGQATGSGGGGAAGAAGSSSSSGAAGLAMGGAAVGGASTGGSGGAQAGMAGTGGGGGSGGAASKRFECPAGPFPAPDPGDPQTVCQGFAYAHGFNEGPTWTSGAFYFSNFVQGAQGGDTSGDIIKYTPGGECERFIQDVGTNGLGVANNGNLLGASHKSRAVIEFDLVSKQPTTLSAMYMNEMLDSPNDLVMHANGSIYFSNPTYELGGRPQGVGPAIFWRNPGGDLTPLKQGGQQPNGVALSADGARLYVVNGGLWDVAADGTPSNQRDFPLNADGLGVDCAGNVYLSGGSIRDPDGQEIGTFSGGTNLAFGGPDGKTLFVVGPDTNVKVIETNVPGLP